jgi:beta-lactamase regulating signal transducer with metallopeptidase domain
MSFLQMSFAGAVMILVITVIRALTINRLPKKTFLVLWGITLVRLLIPFSLPSMFSVYSLFAKSTQLMEVAENTPTVLVPNVPTEQVTATAETITETATSISVWAVIWAVGVLVCTLFFTFTYWKCLREFRATLPVENDFTKRWLTEHPLKRPVLIRQSDRISAPLTFGISHPVILMPKATDWSDETALQYILAHEYVHIRRFDTVTKLILMVTLCVHWFNPLVWVMYVLANRDLELSCDESVIRQLGENTKSAYARTLIRMEETRSGLRPLCNSFSKNAIEERIVAIMKMKKTSLAAMLTAAIVIVGVGTVFATSAQATSNSSDENTASLIADEAILSTTDENGTVQYSADGGQTYLDEEEFLSQYSIPDVEWWTYEEYKAWLEDEKVQLQSMIGEKGWTNRLGEFVWTQEIVDETIAQYEKTLEEIRDGKKVSKPIQDGDTMIQFGYDETAIETAAQDDTTAMTDEYTMSVVTNEYTTESGDTGTEFIEDMAKYAPFGVTFVQSGNFGNLYWNGELVDILVDQSPDGGYTTISSEDEGGIKIQTVYDSNGKLAGVEVTEPLP